MGVLGRWQGRGRDMARSYEDALTVAQVAERYPVSRRTLYRLMDEGVLRWWVPSGLHRRRLVWRQDVEAWLMGMDAPRD